MYGFFFNEVMTEEEIKNKKKRKKKNKMNISNVSTQTNVSRTLQVRT